MGTTASHYFLLILSVLADGDRHGYAIKKEVERRMDGGLSLATTSLYRLLGQLLDEGLIAERAATSDDDDPRRRYYRITPAGRREMAAELERLQRILIAAKPARRTT